jgi:hypothetical protein
MADRLTAGVPRAVISRWRRDISFDHGGLGQFDDSVDKTEARSARALRTPAPMQRRARRLASQHDALYPQYDSAIVPSPAEAMQRRHWSVAAIRARARNCETTLMAAMLSAIGGVELAQPVHGRQVGPPRGVKSPPSGQRTTRRPASAPLAFRHLRPGVASFPSAVSALRVTRASQARIGPLAGSDVSRRLGGKDHSRGAQRARPPTANAVVLEHSTVVVSAGSASCCGVHL